MTSRERVLEAIEHRRPDRVPLDLGAAPTTGMAASAVYRLRRALGLSHEGEPVKVIEPFQMLGEIAGDLRHALGVDVVGVQGRSKLFGFEAATWKEWQLFDGTPVLVPEKFNTQPEPDGSILQYPMGDRSYAPSARMPAGGFYFDAIVRQPPLDEATLKVEDNLEEFQPLAPEAVEFMAAQARRFRQGGDSAVMIIGPGTAFGDIALVPAPWLANPCGIRDIEEWYVSLVARPDFVREIFRRQAEVALDNLRRLWQSIGDNADIIYMSGTDFGTQAAPFLSIESYRQLYQPYQRQLNDWVHANTTWKTFQHSCGAVEPLIPHFIEAGFDILNPVQTSAAGMDPTVLKERYGAEITFWGGGVDTQRTLPRGTPEEVRREAIRRLEIFAPGGGFVFNPVHNVQADVPAENLLALYEAVREFRY